MKTYKFISRLVVGIALIVLAGIMIWTAFNTVVVPRLPLRSGADYVQDMSGSLTEPDKTYAVSAISKAARDNKIAIVLDYQLTTFDITDSYIEKAVGGLVDNVYKNQPYVVYTYFKDTNRLVITTNIDDESKDVVDKTKVDIDTNAKIVKEILYYQQNLERKMGLKNWNFNLTPTAARNTIFETVGSIILLILGFGVLPGNLRNPFKKRAKRVKQEG